MSDTETDEINEVEKLKRLIQYKQYKTNDEVKCSPSYVFNSCNFCSDDECDDCNCDPTYKTCDSIRKLSYTYNNNKCSPNHSLPWDKDCKDKSAIRTATKKRINKEVSLDSYGRLRKICNNNKGCT